MEQAKAEMGEKPRREAEAKLRAAMPFPLQLADPAKLGPAIEAAKAAGVARATVAAAEAKLKDSERKKAEQQLRAAMPFLLQPADPAKLGPAIEAAKAAGVASATLAASGLGRLLACRLESTRGLHVRLAQSHTDESESARALACMREGLCPLRYVCARVATARATADPH